MSRPFVILVAGFGRCGSSMTMQMLEAGGVPVTGQWPTFEDERGGFGAAFDPAWIAAQTGGAVKLLEPQRRERALPAGSYRIVWLDRDPLQQARSAMKMLALFQGTEITRAQVRGMARLYRRDRGRALEALMKLGPLRRLRFEEILRDPYAAATEIASFCRIDVSAVAAMARAVRARGPECLPDMDMEINLTRERLHG